MAHPVNPILRGLALSLALIAPLAGKAAAQSVSARDYNGAPASGPASRNISPGAAAPENRLVTAQADSAFDGDARKKLRSELDLIRRRSAGGAEDFDPPLPVRKRAGQAAAGSWDPPAQQAQAADPRIDRLMGQLLLLGFKGTQPGDPGAKAIRALLQSGSIAGVVFGAENIQTRAQLKEVMKFILPAGNANRPMVAIRETGGASDPFPASKDFERWPSEQDVAAKGDPQYAYSTYRSMGASLAALGFSLNFGPVLAAPGDSKDPGASFGGNPLQTGVFAKTFILGHREENVLAVPIVDGTAHSVRALKTILVSDSTTPIGTAIEGGSEASPFSAYQGLIKGARFCMAGAATALSGFKRGCDIVALDAGTDSPAAVRDQIALGLSQAIETGELSIDALDAAAERARGLRAPSQSGWPASAAKSR
jgi:Glycosyl hydrolase family 3 N terminal domain